MKKLFLLAGLLFLAASPVVSDPPPAAGEPFKSVIAHPKWKTYSNMKYGFSIQYPVGKETRSIKPHKDIYAEDILNFPTIYANEMVRIYTFNDQSVKKWNKGFPDATAFDAYPFPFKMKVLYRAIQLPIGSACRDIPGAKIVLLNGEKAICFQDEMEIKYYCFRGGTLWVEVDLDTLIFSIRPSPNSRILKINQAQKEAEEAVLKTLKFFEPEKK